MSVIHLIGTKPQNRVSSKSGNSGSVSNRATSRDSGDRRRGFGLLVRIQGELEPDTEISRNPQEIGWKALALSCHIALLNSVLEWVSLDFWECNESSWLSVILFEEPNRVPYLHLELEKSASLATAWNPEALGILLGAEFGYCDIPRRTTTMGFNVDLDRNSSTAKLVPLTRRTHGIRPPRHRDAAYSSPASGNRIYRKLTHYPRSRASSQTQRFIRQATRNFEFF
jgi:hypothetical protein